jgi:hypothetical protein
MDQFKRIDQLINDVVTHIARQTYSIGGSALYAGTGLSQGPKADRIIFAILDEVSPE